MENWFNIFGWFISIVTVAGNGFVIFLVAKNRRLHTSANWFVLSLAVADFGVGVAVFPSNYFCEKSMACNPRVYMAFFWFLLHSSVTNLCTLTWDRYIAIVHPFKYNTSLTVRRPGMVILTAWLIPFAISLLLLVGMYVTNSNTAWKVLRLTGVSAFDIISCALLFYAVVRILVVTRTQSLQVSAIELQIQSNHLSTESHQESAIELQVQSNHSSTASHQVTSHAASTETATPRRRVRKKHNVNTARFIIAVVVFFLGCYIVVNSLVLYISFSSTVSYRAGQVIILLLVLNSAVNPLVYACLKKDIKTEVSKLICRENKKERSDSSQAR